MEIMEILSSRWLEVAVAVYLIGMMLYGHYRGFIKICSEEKATLCLRYR